MDKLNQTVCVRQWQLFAMLLLSGYAAGAMLARLATAVGA